MPNAAFDLNSLFSAENATQTADAIPVANTAQRFQGESKAFAEIGSGQVAVDLAIGQHNAVVAQKLAQVEEDRAVRANIDAVDLAAHLDAARGQVDTLRAVANNAQVQQGALLQERQKLTENFPGWLQNPLGRVTAAYKISQLDEKLAGLQKNAELATVSSNELNSRTAATIREEEQANQLRRSGQYNESIALVRNEFAGQGEMLNAYNQAFDTMQEETAKQVSLTQVAASNALSNAELKLRKDAADEEKAVIDQASRDWLRMKKQPENPENMNRARMLVGSLSAPERTVFGKLTTMAGNAPLDPTTVKRNLITSGVSLGGLRRFGTLLDDAELSNVGESVYTSTKTAALAQLRQEAFNNSTNTVEGKTGRYMNNMPVTQEAWWAGLKPAERNAMTEQADQVAKQKMDTSSVASLNMLSYGALTPQHHFSITTNTPAEVTRIFGFMPGTKEHAVMLDPKVRMDFETASTRDPANSGPNQFRALHDAFKAAGVEDPAAATSKAITAYSRGYASTTSDGKWLAGLGIDLPAYYVVEDANGQSRNLANPEELRKYMLLSDKQRVQSKERGFIDKVSGGIDSAVYSILETSPWSDAGKARKLNEKDTVGTGGAVTGGKSFAPDKPDKKLQGGALKKKAYEVRAYSLQDVNNFGTDKLPAVTLDISGELNEAELRKLNSPEQIAARAAALNANAGDVSMRDVLQSRARDNAASIAAMQKSDAARSPTPAEVLSTQANDPKATVFTGADTAGSQQLWKPLSSGAPDPTEIANVMEAVAAVQKAPTPAAKDQGFLELVRDLYKRAFSRQAAQPVDSATATAQQQAESAAFVNGPASASKGLWKQ
jgi:hypothetical protein